MQVKMIQNNLKHVQKAISRSLLRSQKIKHKKVLLRERKRHTAHRIASTRCAGLVGVGGGVAPLLGKGVPPSAGWGTPLPGKGVPTSAGWGTLPSAGCGAPLSAGWGTPHQLDGVPLPPTWEGGTSPVSWMGYPPPPHQLDGVPPVNWTGYSPRCELTDKLKILPSPSFGCGR